MNPTIALIFCLIASLISAALVSAAILSVLIKNPPEWSEGLGTLKVAAAISLPGWFTGVVSFALFFSWVM